VVRRTEDQNRNSNLACPPVELSPASARSVSPACPEGLVVAKAQEADGDFMASWQRTSHLFLLELAAVGLLAAQQETAIPTPETITTRMVTAAAGNRTRLRSYRVTRDYQLFGKQGQPAKFDAIADVTFVPPAFKAYAIRQARGGSLGEKIVRRMLDNEIEIAKSNGASGISSANYELRFIREEYLDGRRCYVLELLPKRQDGKLLKGRIWVDATTYLLHRMEGEPGKSPSWWLRDVRIAFVYGEVNGMWLQIGSESTANVRIVGPHTMVSRDVDYEMSDTVSSGLPTETVIDSFRLPAR
jgi:hypothetical protein